MRKSDAKVPATSSLNAHAPEFTPQRLPGDSAFPDGHGGHDHWTWKQERSAWDMSVHSQFPEVVPGVREGEFLGLQCILPAPGAC